LLFTSNDYALTPDVTADTWNTHSKIEQKIDIILFSSSLSYAVQIAAGTILFDVGSIDKRANMTVPNETKKTWFYI